MLRTLVQSRKHCSEELANAKPELVLNLKRLNEVIFNVLCGKCIEIRDSSSLLTFVMIFLDRFSCRDR